MKKALFPLALIGIIGCYQSIQGTSGEQDLKEISGRTYLVRTPSSYNSKSPVPLVIVLHGYTGSAHIMEHYTQFSAKAESAGFIAVYPNGTGEPRQWNIGLQIDSYINKADDIAFISALIDKLSSDYAIDQKQVFVVGHSNGGEMAYRLANELHSKICAVASVSGSYLYNYTPPTHPIPVIHFHGLADPIVPYSGDAYSKPVDSVMTMWVQLNGCETASTIIYQNGNVKGQKWVSSSSMDVVLYTITGWGHNWPYSHDAGISAVDTIWDFFKNHPKP